MKVLSKDDIECGSLVGLRSGGPAMTVVDVDDADSVTTQWFDDDSQLHKETFPIQCLTDDISDDDGDDEGEVEPVVGLEERKKSHFPLPSEILDRYFPDGDIPAEMSVAGSRFFSVRSRLGDVEKEIGKEIQLESLDHLVILALKFGRFSIMGAGCRNASGVKNDTDFPMIYFENDYD